MFSIVHQFRRAEHFTRLVLTHFRHRLPSGKDGWALLEEVGWNTVDNLY
jgi:hypothetical protein